MSAGDQARNSGRSVWKSALTAAALNPVIGPQWGPMARAPLPFASAPAFAAFGSLSIIFRFAGMVSETWRESCGRARVWRWVMILSTLPGGSAGRKRSLDGGVRRKRMRIGEMLS